MRRMTILGLCLLVAASLGTPRVNAQERPGVVLNVAVIDVPRLVTDSTAGKKVLGVLQKLSEEKSSELQLLADELEGIQARINEGRLSLSEERLSELQRELEDKGIAFRRARDDADRQLQEMQAQRFGEIETKIMPIINDFGVERGYSLVFNKYESGLVFANDAIDITDDILQRFDAATQGEGTED